VKKPQKNGPKPSGLYFLAVVVGCYLLLFFLSPDKTAASLAKSAAILAKLLPVLLVVIVLLGLINHFFNAKALSKHLGRESGVRAWLLAVAGGILSHGPSYIWYPMLADLRTRGVREGLVATFLYVRAIKLPWLPVMVDYFGWQFTALLSLYLILFGLLQGKVIEWGTMPRN
jgi:uncharacterized membrane protein YraQ (UPF0718 family)